MLPDRPHRTTCARLFRRLSGPLALAATVVILAATPASAFFNWKVQRWDPRTRDFARWKATVFPGMAFDLGGVIGKHLGLEFGVGWFSAETPSSGLSVAPITLSAFGELPLGAGGLYALGGTGLYVVDYWHVSSLTYYPVPNGRRAPSVGSPIYEVTVGTPGYQVGAGAWIGWLSIEGRYVFATPRIANRDRRIDGLVLAAGFGVH